MADGADDIVELLVVLANAPLQLVQTSGKLGVCRKNFSQAHERPHDLDVDANGPLAAENAREHGDALLGEGQRQVFSVPAATGL